MKVGQLIGVGLLRGKVYEGARVEDSKGSPVRSAFPPDRSVDPGRSSIQEVLDSEAQSE